MVAKRTARAQRTQTINQARALILTGPDDPGPGSPATPQPRLVAELASLRPRPGSIVRYATRCRLRELGRRAQFLDGQLERLDELIVPLVTARAPGLLAPLRRRPGHRRPAAHRRRGPPRTAAVRSRLGAPVRCRPDPGVVREGHPPPAQPRRRPPGQPRPVADRDHPDELPSADPRLRRRRSKEGLSKKEIIRCLKRYVAREVYPHLRPAPS